VRTAEGLFQRQALFYIFSEGSYPDTGLFHDSLCPTVYINRLFGGDSNLELLVDYPGLLH
jgi:hypothetical protein